MDSAKLYEGMFLMDSNLAQKDWSSLETHILDILKKNRADVVYSEKWPDRRLAYDIKGAKKGTRERTTDSVLSGAASTIG